MSHPAEQTNSVSSKSIKPRKSWRRRIGYAFLFLVIALGIAHALWTWGESRALRQRIAAIQEAGEPILPTDFVIADADPEDNAVIDLQRAASLLNRTDEEWKKFSQVEQALPLTPEDVETMEVIVNRSAASLKIIDDAKGKRRIDWAIDVSIPSQMMESMLPSLNGIRALTTVLGAVVLLDHQRGNDASAIARINQIIFTADIVDGQPSLVGHLVAIGIRAKAVDKLLQIAPDLRIGSLDGDAPPQEIHRLCDLLLDDAPVRHGLVWAVSGERMFELAVARDISAKSRYWFRPVMDHNASLMMKQSSAVLKATSASNWPIAKAMLPPPINDPLAMALAKIMTFDRAIQQQYRILTDQRLGSIILALRWYAVDHDGGRAVQLDDLVPQYLSALPLDPQAADARPMAYRAADPDPVVYSVGSNGVDDNGSESPTPMPQQLTGPADPWSRADRVVHLRRQPRPPRENE